MENTTILMVDDSPENLDILKGLLSADYSLKASPNGKIALKIANMIPHPDLILLDIMMPIMDGFEVLKEMKKNVVFLVTKLLISLLIYLVTKLHLVTHL